MLLQPALIVKPAFAELMKGEEAKNSYASVGVYMQLFGVLLASSARVVLDNYLAIHPNVRQDQNFLGMLG